MTRRRLILAGLGLVLAAVAGLILQKELLLRSGRSVFLPLAPVDPRSLIQGDYMVLTYAISNQARLDSPELPADGALVLSVDGRGVATFRAFADPQRPLSENELLLRYRRRGSSVRLGAEAFYFQEGKADAFARAAFGELKVAPSGQSVLVGLRDKELNPLP